MNEHRDSFARLRPFATAWHADLRRTAAAARKRAKHYGLAFVLLFVMATQISGPSWMHWSAFFIGAWCGSQALKYWFGSVTLIRMVNQTPIPGESMDHSERK
jgi:protein-S-isoprenylcysteine O-methyltransferase Ste14